MTFAAVAFLKLFDNCPKLIHTTYEKKKGLKKKGGMGGRGVTKDMVRPNSCYGRQVCAA